MEGGFVNNSDITDRKEANRGSTDWICIKQKICLCDSCLGCREILVYESIIHFDIIHAIGQGRCWGEWYIEGDVKLHITHITSCRIVEHQMLGIDIASLYNLSSIYLNQQDR